MILSTPAILAKNRIHREDFQMFELTPIAFATPDGNFQVNRRFRWIPDHTLKAIEAIEDDHFHHIVEDVSERGIYLKEFNPQTAPRTIGFRKDATLREGSESMRRKRGPGFKRNMRLAKIDASRVARIKNEIKGASMERLQKYDFDVRLVRDHRLANRLYDLIWSTISEHLNNSR